MSSNSPLGFGSPSTAKIQLRTSVSTSLLRGYRTIKIAGYFVEKTLDEVVVISRNISTINLVFLESSVYWFWFMRYKLARPNYMED